MLIIKSPHARFVSKKADTFFERPSLLFMELNRLYAAAQMLLHMPKIEMNQAAIRSAQLSIKFSQGMKASFFFIRPNKINILKILVKLLS